MNQVEHAICGMLRWPPVPCVQLKFNCYFLGVLIYSRTDSLPPTHPPARKVGGKSHEFRPFEQYPREGRDDGPAQKLRRGFN